MRWPCSCHLNGTGFMVSDALIRDMGWNTGTLTEDLEFTALCALRGYRISWMPNARIFDEQPVRFRDSVVQRRRWTSGSLQCMRRYAKALIEKKTAVSLDIGCLFLGNLLNYVGILSGMATVVALLSALSEGFDLARYAPASAGLWYRLLGAVRLGISRHVPIGREALRQERSDDSRLCVLRAVMGDHQCVRQPDSPAQMENHTAHPKRRHAPQAA